MSFPKIQFSNFWRKFFLGVLILWVSVGVFWKLGYGSLHPWDEAWYADISRTIVRSGDIFNLVYNQEPYYDHPPLGFWLKALSMRTLGESTFSVRLPEAMMAILSVYLVYQISRRLSSSWAGFWSATMLLSSRWFLFRARTGNLDVLLLVTQLLVVLALVYALFSKKEKGDQVAKNKWGKFLGNLFKVFNTGHGWIYSSWFFLGLSLSSKSFISFQLLPLVLIASIYYGKKNLTEKNDLSRLVFLRNCILFMLLAILPWLVAGLIDSGIASIQKQVRIGFRSGSKKTINMENISRTLGYFNAAVHKWYKVMLRSMGMVLVGLLHKDYRKKFAFLFLYVSLVVGPYMISSMTEIWHLVPLVGAMSVVSGVVIDVYINEFFGSKRLKINKKLGELGRMGTKALFTVLVLGVAVISTKAYWSEFINVPNIPMDYEKITWHIQEKTKDVYLMIDDYFPSIVYYADLEGAYVKYIKPDKFEQVCLDLTSKGDTMQFIDVYEGWLSKRIDEAKVQSREGELVLMSIDSSDCDY